MSGRKVFSSSLWLCDCLLHVLVIRDVSEGNSMGLILDARDVGYAGLVEQARFIQPLRVYMMR
jgi:hypothetical protein